MGNLRVEISDTTTPTVIVLNGALDLDTARFLRDRFDLVVNSGVTDVVIDLRQVSFVDATGLGILLGGLRRLNEKGHVTVRSPPDEVRRFILVHADKWSAASTQVAAGAVRGAIGWAAVSLHLDDPSRGAPLGGIVRERLPEQPARHGECRLAIEPPRQGGGAHAPFSFFTSSVSSGTALNRSATSP